MRDDETWPALARTAERADQGGWPAPGAAPGPGRLVRALRTARRELAGLVLPVQCAGCGQDDEAWCAACRAEFDVAPWRCEARAGRLDPLDADALPVRTLADCVGPARAVVIAWKDRGRRDLTAPLVRLAERLGAAVAADVVPVLAAAVASSHAAAAAHGAIRAGFADVLVVPAPSTPAARRRRGFAHADELARGVAAGLRAVGVPAHASSVLRRSGGEQVGLGVRDRGRSAARVQVSSRHRGAVRGRAVVLVDDVLTSGATLAGAARALVAAGAVPLAAVTLASTPGPRTDTSGRPVTDPREGARNGPDRDLQPAHAAPEGLRVVMDAAPR